MIGTFNRNVVKVLRDSMQLSLSEFEQKFGVKINVADATYTDSNITFKVEVANMVDGEVKSKETVNFERLCTAYGFQPEDLGKEFSVMGKGRFSIVGLKPRNRKYPIICQEVGSRGLKYKFPAGRVLNALRQEEEQIHAG